MSWTIAGARGHTTVLYSIENAQIKATGKKEDKEARAKPWASV
jgi:hypothetical protein